MKRATVIAVKNSRKSIIGWQIATREGDVIQYTPLKSKDLEVAVKEARRKLGRGWKVVAPRLEEQVTTT